MTSAEIRERLGLSRSELARALGVAEPTVARWEKKDHAPSGVAAEIFNAIENALGLGVDPKLIARRLKLGIAALIYLGLSNETPISKRAS